MAAEAAFEGLAEPFRRELHVHCYRMLASFDEVRQVSKIVSGETG